MPLTLIAYGVLTLRAMEAAVHLHLIQTTSTRLLRSSCSSSFQPLVANAKLDRPLDSHPPLSRELMLTRLETDDWGDTADGTQYEQENHGYNH